MKIRAPRHHIDIDPRPFLVPVRILKRRLGPILLGDSLLDCCQLRYGGSIFFLSLRVVVRPRLSRAPDDGKTKK